MGTLIKQLGIKHLVVFVNKCDAADEEMIELVEMEIRELLEAMGFSEDSTPIVKGSALCALDGSNPELGEKAIEELMNIVDSTIPTPDRDLEVPFLMAIDGVHNIQGRGCVITGRLERGKLKVGQDVDILGYNKAAKGKVTGIEMFHKILEEANAGDQMGLLARGDMQLMCFSKTWDCAGFIKLVGKEMALPGEDATMDIRLLKQMVLEEGQHFTIRDSKGTIGTGKVTKVNPNLTEEEHELMTMNKAKREKTLAKKSQA